MGGWATHRWTDRKLLGNALPRLCAAKCALRASLLSWLMMWVGCLPHADLSDYSHGTAEQGDPVEPTPEGTDAGEADGGSLEGADGSSEISLEPTLAPDGDGADAGAVDASTSGDAGTEIPDAASPDSGNPLDAGPSVN